VLAATVVAGGSPFEEEADLDVLIELNRDAWHAAQEGWEALYAFSAPVREQILADPLAGFRAIMDSAPARDQAVIDDPAWQRVYRRLLQGMDGVELRPRGRLMAASPRYLPRYLPHVLSRHSRHT
jgi:hypothetical protein